jgi:Zn-dependent peptidase ImmA (M78 family)/DNA-binding transcriptional regulator YiaG
MLHAVDRMAKTVEALVKPALLQWARADAGLSVDDAAGKVPVAAERLRAWENGEERPTIAQLRKLAVAYKRPLAVFFLPKPPKDFAALKDFRRKPGKVAGVLSPELRFAIRRARDRRELAVELYPAIEGDPHPFTPRASLAEDPETVAQRLRSFLGVTIAEQVTWGPGYSALRHWRSALEEHEVLVFQARDVDPEELLGFSIGESVLPVIVVNIKDFPNRRTFTLLHELSHLALRLTGLCDLDEHPKHPPEERRVEVFCNHVAGAALVPRDDLLAQPIVAPAARTFEETDLRRLAARYGVSREVVVRRLLTLGRVSEGFYRRKRAEYDAEPRHKTAGFAPPHLLAVAQAGHLFTRLVLSGYYQDRVTATDLSEYLAVRLAQVPKIEAEVMGRIGGAA